MRILPDAPAGSPAYSDASGSHCASALKVAFWQPFSSLNALQRRSPLFVASFYCGGAVGLPGWKLHVSHEFQEPGELRPNTGHIQNAVWLDVDAI